MWLFRDEPLVLNMLKDSEMTWYNGHSRARSNAQPS